MTDATILGQMAARTMESIEEHFGEDCVLRTAAIIVEVDTGPTTRIWVESTDDRFWVTKEFLGVGMDHIDRLSDAVLDDREADDE